MQLPHIFHLRNLHLVMKNGAAHIPHDWKDPQYKSTNKKFKQFSNVKTETKVITNTQTYDETMLSAQ